jgi:hypothetical protein
VTTLDRIDRALALGEAAIALSFAEDDIGAHATPAATFISGRVAIVTLRRADELWARRKGKDALWERHTSLMRPLRSLLALQRWDEALDVVHLSEEVRASWRFVPDHGSRAQVFEARGDLHAAATEYLALVPQYEAAPEQRDHAGAVYGPEGRNTALARGWARQALAKAGRDGEADLLLRRPS